MKQRRKELREIIHNWRHGEGCEHCGESHPATIDFHHETPAQKKFSIGKAMALLVTDDALMAELRKCIKLCSNCHRKFHWRERQEAMFEAWLPFEFEF